MSILNDIYFVSNITHQKIKFKNVFKTIQETNKSNMQLLTRQINSSIICKTLNRFFGAIQFFVFKIYNYSL